MKHSGVFHTFGDMVTHSCVSGQQWPTFLSYTQHTIHISVLLRLYSATVHTHLQQVKLPEQITAAPTFTHTDTLTHTHTHTHMHTQAEILQEFSPSLSSLNKQPQSFSWGLYIKAACQNGTK